MIVELFVASCLGFQIPAPAAEPAQVPPTPATPPVATQGSAGALPRTPEPPPVPSQPAGEFSVRSVTPAPAVALPQAPRTPSPPYGFPGMAPAQGMGSGWSTTPALAGANGFYLSSRRMLDPKESDLERKSRELAVNMQREQDPAKKADMKKSLLSVVAEQFELRQQRRGEEIKRLEDELRRLKDANEKREKAKEQIIARRLAELTGDDDLGF